MPKKKSSRPGPQFDLLGTAALRFVVYLVELVCTFDLSGYLFLRRWLLRYQSLSSLFITIFQIKTYQ